MKQLHTLLFVLALASPALCSSVLIAQTPVRPAKPQSAELYVGGVYAIRAYDHTQLGSSGGAAGFDTALNLTAPGRLSFLGLTADVSGIFGGGEQAYLFTFGPQLSRRFGRETAFVHALGGGAHLNNFHYFPLKSNLSVAAVLGGGVDTNISRRFAVRVGADYLYTDFIAAGQEENQIRLLGSNFRIGSGLVYRF